jgi:hypothetical protein
MAPLDRAAGDDELAQKLDRDFDRFATAGGKRDALVPGAG